jgi:hypothetical protein
LVFFPPIECGRGTIDDHCGCRRSMVGLVSHRATTTIKVIERPDLDPDISSTLIADGLQSHCYVIAELMANRKREQVGARSHRRAHLLGRRLPSRNGS